MKILILGIGNPLRGNDAVGIEAANNIKNFFSDRDIDIDVKTASTTNIDILNIISGYDKVVIIDAVKTADRNLGRIHILHAKHLKSSSYHILCNIRARRRISTDTFSVAEYTTHNIDLGTTLEIGRALGMKIPKITIYGIEVGCENEDFKQGLSKRVKAAVPAVTKKILNAALA